MAIQRSERGTRFVVVCAILLCYELTSAFIMKSGDRDAAWIKGPRLPGEHVCQWARGSWNCGPDYNSFGGIPTILLDMASVTNTTSLTECPAEYPADPVKTVDCSVCTNGLADVRVCKKNTWQVKVRGECFGCLLSLFL